MPLTALHSGCRLCACLSTSLKHVGSVSLFRQAGKCMNIRRNPNHVLTLARGKNKKRGQKSRSLQPCTFRTKKATLDFLSIARTASTRHSVSLRQAPPPVSALADVWKKHVRELDSAKAVLCASVSCTAAELVSVHRWGKTSWEYVIA